jgi:hypothetical protein
MSLLPAAAGTTIDVAVSAVVPRTPGGRVAFPELVINANANPVPADLAPPLGE